jgi:hypothetical protein
MKIEIYFDGGCSLKSKTTSGLERGLFDVYGVKIHPNSF